VIGQWLSGVMESSCDLGSDSRPLLLLRSRRVTLVAPPGRTRRRRQEQLGSIRARAHRECAWGGGQDVHGRMVQFEKQYGCSGWKRGRGGYYGPAVSGQFTMWSWAPIQA
jgi:hypothetical protein